MKKLNILVRLAIGSATVLLMILGSRFIEARRDSEFAQQMHCDAFVSIYLRGNVAYAVASCIHPEDEVEVIETLHVPNTVDVEKYLTAIIADRYKHGNFTVISIPCSFTDGEFHSFAGICMMQVSAEVY
jgi:hypothetical protein